MRELAPIRLKNRFLLLLLLPFAGLHAQVSLSVTPPGALSVCQSGATEIAFTNNADTLLAEVLLTLSLPECLQYVPGSLLNAQESDLSNLNAPVFALADLLPGQSTTIAWETSAGCGCINAINSGTLFFDLATLSWAGGNQSWQTPAYNVTTPLLVFSAVTNTFISAAQGDVVERTFTLRNTRFGRLDRLLFLDVHQGGIQISADPGMVLLNQHDSLLLELDGDDFALIGNGDAWFDYNETITITETLLVTDCGFSQFSTISNIQVTWGCADTPCQTLAQAAVVQFLPASLETALQAYPAASTPTCFCAGDAAPQSLLLVNQGFDGVEDLFLTLTQDIDGSGIDPASLQAWINGTPTNFTSVPGTSFSPGPPCAPPGTLSESQWLIFDFLAPGDTLLIQWNVFTCQPSCNAQPNRWKYTYRFKSECTQTIFDLESFQEVEDPAPPFFTQISVPASVADGAGISLGYTLFFEALSSQSGELEIQWQLPCGLDASGNTFLLGGQPPLAIDETADSSFTEIRLTYALPLPSDQVSMDVDLLFTCDTGCAAFQGFCEKTYVSSCENLSMVESLPSLLPLQILTTLNNCGAQGPACGWQDCVTAGIHYTCDLSGTSCTDTIRGYWDFQFSVQRTSLGLPDNDNNWFPDPGGALDLDLIRLDRAMVGDTFLASLQATVVADDPTALFPSARFSLLWLPAGQYLLDNPELVSPDGLQYAGATLSIYDQSEDLWFVCTNLPATPVDSAGQALSFEFLADPSDPALAACGLPADFVFEDQDSLRIDAHFVLAHNPLSTNGIPPIVPVSVVPRLFLRDALASEEDPPLYCLPTPSAVQLELGGYSTQLLPGLFGLPPCDTSAFFGGTFLEVRLGADQFFPFEYRPLGAVEAFVLTLPEEIALQVSRIKTLKTIGGPTLKEDSLVTPFSDPVDNTHTYQLSSCFGPPPDEGFSLLLQFQFEVPCDQEEAEALTVSASIVGLPDIPVDSSQIETATSEALKPLFPNLALSSPLASTISLDNRGRWVLQLQNIPTLVGSQQSGHAPHTWLFPESNTGLLSDFMLVRLPGNDTIAPLNGLFQVGDVPPDTLWSFELIALNGSCAPETLQLHYGWGCEALAQANGPTCWTETLTLSVLSPDGELEMEVYYPDTCVLLCDTLPFHEVHIFNADLGTICEPVLKAFLPPGFQVLPGSCEMAFPGDGLFEPIPDPLLLPNGEVQWDLAGLNTALGQNCLPGNPAAPLHSLRLRFLGESNCDFLAQEGLIFVLSGKQNCGLAANTIARQAPAVCIETLLPAGETLLNAGFQQAIGCLDTVTLAIGFLHEGAFLSDDSISVWLPAGLQYVPGSVNGIFNPPPGEPTLFFAGSQQLLQWGFPPGLSSGSVVSFQIKLAGFTTLACGATEWVQVHTSEETLALCAASGDTCSIRIQTGSFLIPFEVKRPNLLLTQFSLHVYPSDTLEEVHYELAFENQGVPFSQDLQIDLYLDQDQSQSLSGADIWLNTDTLTGFTAEGSLSGVLHLPPGSSCQLLAIVDTVGQCLCQSVAALPMGPIVYHLPSYGVLCPSDTLTLGICDSTYSGIEWLDVTGGISCDTCCQIQWIGENEGATPLESTVIQQVGAGGNACQIQFWHTFTVPPRAGILYADEAVCNGNPAHLVADPSVGYLWEGPGLSGSTQQAQTVFPEQSGWYQVTVTDENGCVATDSTWVQVWPLPLLGVDSVQAFCPGEVPQLSLSSQPGVDYFWSPPYLFDDPDAPNPVLETSTDSTLLVVTATSEVGCQQTDTLLAIFPPAPPTQGAPDTTLCLGAPALLFAAGATTYQWEAPWPVICLDTLICDSVWVEPGSSGWVLVYGANALCRSADSLFVEVVDDGYTQLDTLSTCAGIPVDVPGGFTDEAGLYCDTLVLSSGCRAFSCIFLEVSDTVRQQQVFRLCPGDSLWVDGTWYADPGLYPDTLTTVNGCDSIVVRRIEWHELPVFELMPADTIVLPGAAVSLEVSGPGVGYSWFPEAGLSCSDCAETTAMLAYSQEIRVEITDVNGCRQERTARIQVDRSCAFDRIQLPNVFTPNGDGRNDTFGPIVLAAGLEQVDRLVIWNRWGEVVFEGKGDARWDGMQGDQHAPADVYVFRMEVSCRGDGTRQTLSGEITLLR